jgi:hypothetical protein
MSLILQSLHFLLCAGDVGEVDWVREGGLEVRVIHSYPLVWNDLRLQEKMFLFLRWRVGEVNGVILESSSL